MVCRRQRHVVCRVLERGNTYGDVVNERCSVKPALAPTPRISHTSPMRQRRVSALRALFDDRCCPSSFRAETALRTTFQVPPSGWSGSDLNNLHTLLSAVGTAATAKRGRCTSCVSAHTRGVDHGRRLPLRESDTLLDVTARARGHPQVALDRSIRLRGRGAKPRNSPTDDYEDDGGRPLR